ncbi:MAG TPA: hypothetical protein VJ084_03175 [Nitrospinota bacterium]|nr:hypothetical protein [Nitrospinota bacterium]
MAVVYLDTALFSCYFGLYSGQPKRRRLIHRENQAGMPLLRVSMPSGKKECLEDIIVLPLLSLEKPVNDSCGIIIIRNLTEVLLKKNMAQDSLECLKTTSGNPLDICQRDLALIGTLTLTGISIFLLQRERSLSLEKLTPMVLIVNKIDPLCANKTDPPIYYKNFSHISQIMFS